jgi:anaerobic sulfite reductase subunit B
MGAATAERPPAPGAMTPRSFTVRGRERETTDTWTLVLEPLEGDGPAIGPGQFVMVYAFGVGEVPISVSGPPDRTGPVVLTVRAVGAVTEAICATEPGGVLGLRGPFGTSWPIATSPGADVVVVAGGIGLAPLRPVVLRALERRSEYGSVIVLYGARTPDDLLYASELDAWRREATVDVTVDAAERGWSGRVGVVPKLLPGAAFAPATTVAFVCGPEVMMRFAVRALLDRGVAPDRIHVSLERNMRCGLGHCGHCQLGPTLICRDGPVYSYATAAPWLEVREL